MRTWLSDSGGIEPPGASPTESKDYAKHLRRRADVWWKTILPVQAPYRWHIRHLRLGRTLDVGCGYGRNLEVLASGSIGVSHVLEHMSQRQARSLICTYLPYLRRSGRVVIITPQERGYLADPTHVEFLDFERLQSLSYSTGLVLVQQYSFPLPRWSGRLFPYNEFVVVARSQKQTTSTG